jgi:hypothetical protein
MLLVELLGDYGDVLAIKEDALRPGQQEREGNCLCVLVSECFVGGIWK